MLKSLQVRNYVLIDSLDISFPAGLVIITGQTGAGKSILLGAISLLLGVKSDASMIGSDGDSCVVEGEFLVRDDIVRQAMEEEGLEWSEGSLIIRRVINRSGRSRSFINDEPVPVTVLSRISSNLIDIHSQHQTQLLTNRQYQLSLLDMFCGNEALLRQCRTAYDKVRGTENSLLSLRKELADYARQKEYAESRLSRLLEADLKEGELEELEQEQKCLANAEEIRTSFYGVEDRFCPEDDERLPLDAALKESVKLLDKAARYVESAASLSQRVESARLELDDVLAEVRSLSSAIDVSPERLEFVESRMSLLYDLMRKYQCSDVTGLISERDRLSGLVYGSEALEEKIKETEAALDVCRAELKSISELLHESRYSHSESFASSIQTSIRYLELERAAFDLRFEDKEIDGSGRDSVSFEFSATGSNLVDVAKCASGGEKSRIMLCLKDMMARYTNMPSMIFDEIDTGVSGSVADKMGSMICRMGDSMQVFAITHLPQVAAKGDAHFLVTKAFAEDGNATTAISQLNGDDRVMELSRMLSGSSVSPEAIANAKSLLANPHSLF